MRVKIPLLLLTAFCAAGAGCASCAYNDTPSFYYYALRNVIEAPVKCLDTDVMLCRDRRRADAAWRDVVRSCPEQSCSKDYALGFKEGYVHYLEVGTGQPPAVPPSRYRLTCYQNPAGVAAIEDWFAGFRHGADVGRASGYRETIVVPLSDPPVNAVPRERRLALPGAADGHPAGPAAPEAPPEQLPAPRRLLPPPAPQAEPAGTPDSPGTPDPADPAPGVVQGEGGPS
jgi:hypothetical protein